MATSISLIDCGRRRGCSFRSRQGKGKTQFHLPPLASISRFLDTRQHPLSRQVALHTLRDWWHPQSQDTHLRHHRRRSGGSGVEQRRFPAAAATAASSLHPRERARYGISTTTILAASPNSNITPPYSHALRKTARPAVVCGGSWPLASRGVSEDRASSVELPLSTAAAANGDFFSGRQPARLCEACRCCRPHPSHIHPGSAARGGSTDAKEQASAASPVRANLRRRARLHPVEQTLTSERTLESALLPKPKPTSAPRFADAQNTF